MNDTRKFLVDDADYELLSCFEWFLAGRCKQTKKGFAGLNGYPTTRFRSSDGAMRIEKVTRFLMPPKEGLVVDHINQNTLDNRRANLRYVTHGENIANTDAAFAHSTTGVRGVHAHSNRPVYSVRCYAKGRTFWVGNYATKEAAHAAFVEFKDRAEKHPETLPAVIRNKSGVRGVTAYGKYWRARVMVEGVSYYLGDYPTVEQAAAVAAVVKGFRK